MAPAVAGVVWLRLEDPGGLGDVLFLLCVVWASDIGAYMVGRWLGGPKLAPAISPNKTWSGAVGAAVGSAPGSRAADARRRGRVNQRRAKRMGVGR